MSGEQLLSYAQQGEDVVLWRAFHDVPNGFYVDVGAHDPVQDSATKLFYDRGWRGLNIEPQRAQYEALCAARPRDINLNLAISDVAGTLVMHEVPAASGLSTFDEGLAAHYRGTDYDVVERTVEVTPLQPLLDQHVDEPVQFLKVDVEGHEARVLSSVDWQRFRPRAIVVEATRPEEWEPLLLANGYTRTLYDGLNLFFVRDEDRDVLGPALSVPANVHDDYETWRYTWVIDDLRQQVAALQARVAQLEQAPPPPPTWRRALGHARRRWQAVRSARSARSTPTTAPPPPPSSPPAGLPLEPLLAILFPHGLDAAQRDAVHALVPDGVVTDASDIRRILAGVDAHLAPSTFTARATRDDLTVCSFDGTEVVLDRADASISHLLLIGHPYEPHLRRVLRALVTPGDTVVDVGANVGIHTVLCAQLVGPTGQVVAVEANPENCRLILLSVEHNRLTNVRLVPLALGPAAGHCFFGPAIGSNGGVRPEGSSRLWDGLDTLVPTTRLDDLGLARVDLLKIDVEGAEHGVVMGGAATIDAHRPVVITEFSQEMTARVSQVEPTTMLRWFEGRGYQLGLVERDTGIVRPQTVDELLAGWHDPVRIEDLLWWPSERTLPASLLEPPSS